MYSGYLQHSLLCLKEAAVKLQGSSQDIISGIALVEDSSSFINHSGKMLMSMPIAYFSIAVELLNDLK